MRHYREHEIVDVAVIGTGAGGAPLLARLAGAGLSAVALEAGRNWNPRDFPADEVAADGIYWLGERLSAGDTPEAFGANNSGTGVGGSTLHWGAFTPRADARDLRLGTEFGRAVDWPLRYEELVPYYEAVETAIGVSGPAAYPWDTGRRYKLPPVRLNAPAQIMQRACEALGVRSCAAPAAVLPQDVVYPKAGQPEAGLRRACINCGHCHQGCRIGAKASMDVTYLPRAVASGAEIRPGCMVHDLERDGTGRITAVVYREAGCVRRQRCRAVLLCAGAVETPRLLLNLGLCNSSGQVGRNYMAHVATQVWGTFEQEMRPNKGYPSSLITEDMMRAPDCGYEGGYLVQTLGVLPVTWANILARGGGLWGQRLVDMLDRYNHVAGIGINGECLAQDRNFLELADEHDEAGLCKARIHFSYGEGEIAMDRHAVACMTRLWEAAGASDIIAVARSAHTIGTCRMGTDADQAVVDPFGRSFDIDNLWICDNSVFPTSLAANPALTIMALSLRTADAFLRVAR
ncbi:GMC family oxidoreductase [Lichenicoccus sp.]|uniref:GMC family oxidoreductase n=1 Tax=Lichenicoccus sp. TaxID=2781899 RepID=UPI003D0B6564